MLPESIVPARVDRGEIIPGFLGPQDHPWLSVLIDEVDRFRGRRRCELTERLQAPLPCVAPVLKARAASWLLMRSWRGVPASSLDARAVREALFTEAAASGEGRSAVLATVAGRLGTTAAELERALFGDLPRERIVQGPDQLPSPQDVAVNVNLEIAGSLLARASEVWIQVEGAVRPVVRQAKLRGLLCILERPAGGGDGADALRISGPLSLFGPTLLYGRALAELLPWLAWTSRFRLEAHCRWHGAHARVCLASGAPIFPAARPKAFDSKVEERFARDFARLAPGWDVVREPEALAVPGGLVFPDFLLRDRLRPERSWLLEIVGFWTPGYVERKLRQYREAGARRLILAVDQERFLSQEEVPPWAEVVRYRGRLDAAEVLKRLGEPSTASRVP